MGNNCTTTSREWICEKIMFAFNWIEVFNVVEVVWFKGFQLHYLKTFHLRWLVVFGVERYKIWGVKKWPNINTDNFHYLLCNCLGIANRLSWNATTMYFNWCLFNGGVFACLFGWYSSDRDRLRVRWKTMSNLWEQTKNNGNQIENGFQRNYVEFTLTN